MPVQVCAKTQLHAITINQMSIVSARLCLTDSTKYGICILVQISHKIKNANKFWHRNKIRWLTGTWMRSKVYLQQKIVCALSVFCL